VQSIVVWLNNTGYYNDWMIGIVALWNASRRLLCKVFHMSLGCHVTHRG